MEKKTIGAFIAALRKANGLTQQELADKLNISNKAVSRWERDECAPDITLIPALAEILGVTCDELLKGERILSAAKQEKSEAKVDKQIKTLIQRTISKFTILIWISMALSVAGYIFMFGISYGAFRSVIGFAVMSVFAISAFVLDAIATIKMKGAKNENELFENADASLINRYNKILGNYSFTAFATAITVVAISLPLIIIAPYKNSYLEPLDYLVLLGLIIFVFASLWIIFKDKYCLWITEQPHEKASSKLILMNCLQLDAEVLAAVLFIIAPYYVQPKENTAEIVLTCLAYAMLAVNAVSFVICISVCKTDRKKLIPSGIRNLLFIIPSGLCQLIHIAYYNYGVYDEIFKWVKKDMWNIEYILLVAGLSLVILVAFALINRYIRKKSIKKEV